jgi:hypothetical protein
LENNCRGALENESPFVLVYRLKREKAEEGEDNRN